jgi:hypothetical protein
VAAKAGEALSSIIIEQVPLVNQLLLALSSFSFLLFHFFSHHRIHTLSKVKEPWLGHW